jgi:hypothetical protein
MAVKSIQAGQIWRENQSGKNFLVTKVYTEVLTQFAMLRAADSSQPSDTLRVKVQKTAAGATLPGYTFAQDTQSF